MTEIKDPVVALVLPRTIGDFVEHSLGAILYHKTHNYDRGNLCLMYAPDRPWKELWMARLRNIVPYTVSMKVPVYLEVFDTGSEPRITIPRDWAMAGLWDPAGFIVPRQMNREALAKDLLEAIPSELEFNVAANPPPVSGEYAVVHWNAHGYSGRPDDPYRAIDDEYAGTLLSFIEDRIGIQPVVIGHQSKNKWTFDQEIDLIAGAKYVIELSPSGPAAMSIAFNKPWLRLNMVDSVFSGDSDLVVNHFQTVVTEEGKKVPMVWDKRKEVVEAGHTFKRMTIAKAKSCIKQFDAKYRDKGEKNA